MPVSFEPLEAKVPAKCLQNPDIVDFLKKCVDKDPARRWSCERLLQHPYFSEYAAQFGDEQQPRTGKNSSSNNHISNNNNNNTSSSSNTTLNADQPPPKGRDKLLGAIGGKGLASNTSLPVLMPGLDPYGRAAAHLNQNVKTISLRSEPYLPTI